MLQVLLYGRTDEEVKYACTEMLDHMGLPYAVVHNLRRRSSSSDVLLFPETSRISRKEAEVIRKSDYSVIFVGQIPHDLQNDVECHIKGTKQIEPPSISGVLKTSGTEAAPFFYDFPILDYPKDKFQKLGEIEADHKAYVGVILREQDSRTFAIIAPQMFKSATYLLAGSEATLPKEALKSLGLIDEYGRINEKKTEMFKRGLLNVPTVNVYERLLLKILTGFSKRRKTFLIHKWFLPKNHDMAMCLTHDVECVLSPRAGLDAIASFRKGNPTDGVAKGTLALTAFVSTILCRLHLSKSKNSLRLLPKSLIRRLMHHNTVWNLHKYIKIEKQFGATSSFFFLMNATDKDSDYDFHNPFVKEAMKLIIDSGSEVGLHGSFESYKDENKMEKEKALLEKALEMRVEGVRQHFLRIAIPDTWKSQELAGFVYDSTLGCVQEIGFRGGCCLPFTPWNLNEKRRLSILEIPLIVVDGAFFQKKYLALSPHKAFQICREFVDIVHKYNGILTLLWHPYTMLIDRKGKESWSDLYPKILTYSLHYNPWYTSGKRLTEWWNLRKKISIRKDSWRGSQITFRLHSPSDYEGFSVRIYIPPAFEDATLFVNNRKLNRKKIIRRREFLLLSFDILKGKNEIKLRV